MYIHTYIVGQVIVYELYLFNCKTGIFVFHWKSHSIKLVNPSADEITQKWPRVEHVQQVWHDRKDAPC